MSRIPREARDGLMRAWLEILRDRHPGVAWVESRQESAHDAPRDAAGIVQIPRALPEGGADTGAALAA